MTDQPIRFSLTMAPTVTFLRYPVSAVPPEGTNAVDTGDDWQSASRFRGVEWRASKGRPMAREVRFWTVMEQGRD